jgi:nucleoside 2-deoxyribosyltransferase
MSWKPRCYVASPLGFSEPGRLYYEQVLLPTLRSAVEIVDPWTLVSADEIARAAELGEERKFAQEIGRRNSEALAGSQLLVAVLDGQELDSGTAAEVGYASALGLTCFGLRSDFRQTGEPGATVNLQVETFILRSGGRITTTPSALCEAIADKAGRMTGAEAVNA